MTTFVIRTREEDDLAFLLFANHDGDWPPAGRNNVMFTSLPFGAGLGDELPGAFVNAHKGQEWIADVGYAEDAMTVRIAFGSGWTFELVSGTNGNSWRAVRGSESIQGTGIFL